MVCRMGMLATIKRALTGPSMDEAGRCAECRTPVAAHEGLRTTLGIFCTPDCEQDFAAIHNGW